MPFYIPLEEFWMDEDEEEQQEEQTLGTAFQQLGGVKKRVYTYKKRKKAAEKERFINSKRLRVEESNKMSDIILAACKCKRRCPEHFQSPELIKRVLDKRNAFHELQSRADRRILLSRCVTKHERFFKFLSIRVCVSFLLAVFSISLNQLYGVVNRVRDNHPVAATISRNVRRGVFTVETAVCGWLFNLASSHDPQPDREFTILAFKRKKHVYEEYLEQSDKGLVPACTLSYFCRVWKKHFRYTIVVRKTMRFALCDDCGRIQREREKTVDQAKLAVLREEEKTHISLVKNERICYEKRRREALSPDANVLSIALDGADQGAYGLPYYCQVHSSLFKSSYYYFIN